MNRIEVVMLGLYVDNDVTNNRPSIIVTNRSISTAPSPSAWIYLAVV